MRVLNDVHTPRFLASALIALWLTGLHRLAGRGAKRLRARDIPALLGRDDPLVVDTETTDVGAHAEVIEVVAIDTAGTGRGMVVVTTATSQHRPWSTIDPESGTVPATWVRELMVSKAVILYAVASHEMRRAIFPMDRSGALEYAPEKNSSFWLKMEDIYRENCGKGSNTPKTLLERIDYGAQISAQLALGKGSRKMVVYPASGDIMRACRVRPGEVIIDFTLYRYVAGSAPEAAYLVGLMNAPCLTNAFSQSRSSSRDFHLHPWRAIPIPKFDRKMQDHVAMARLAQRAERQAKSWLAEIEVEGTRLGQVALSTRARDLLRANGVSGEIDAVARRILPQQAR